MSNKHARKRDTPFQMAAQVCAVGMGAVPWSRVVGAASARLDGVGLDAVLSWKLTAVMGPTTTEVTFLPWSIIFYLFLLSRPSFILVFLADCPLLCPSVSPAEKSASLFVPVIPPCCPSPAESPVESWRPDYIKHICVLLACSCRHIFVILHQTSFKNINLFACPKSPHLLWLFGFSTYALINIQSLFFHSITKYRTKQTCTEWQLQSTFTQGGEQKWKKSQRLHAQHSC